MISVAVYFCGIQKGNGLFAFPLGGIGLEAEWVITGINRNRGSPISSLVYRRIHQDSKTSNFPSTMWGHNCFEILKHFLCDGHHFSICWLVMTFC